MRFRFHNHSSKTVVKQKYHSNIHGIIRVDFLFPNNNQTDFIHN